MAVRHGLPSPFEKRRNNSASRKGKSLSLRGAKRRSNLLQFKREIASSVEDGKPTVFGLLAMTGIHIPVADCCSSPISFTIRETTHTVGKPEG
jgi:hypothetical protein